jgi:hypothetical protein
MEVGASDSLIILMILEAQTAFCANSESRVILPLDAGMLDWSLATAYIESLLDEIEEQLRRVAQLQLGRSRLRVLMREIIKKYHINSTINTSLKGIMF